MSRPFAPRPIAPELVDPGCTVTVVFPQEKGLTMGYTGRVHAVTHRGRTRFAKTQEGRVLFAYEIGSKPSYKISLIARDPEPQTQLEGISFT